MHTLLFQPKNLPQGTIKMNQSTLTQPQVMRWMDSYALRGLTHCPITGTFVQGHDQASFLIPGGEVKWWHCSACQGWHVLIVDNRGKS